MDLTGKKGSRAKSPRCKDKNGLTQGHRDHREGRDNAGPQIKQNNRRKKAQKAQKIEMEHSESKDLQEGKIRSQTFYVRDLRLLQLWSEQEICP